MLAKVPPSPGLCDEVVMQQWVPVPRYLDSMQATALYVCCTGLIPLQLLSCLLLTAVAVCVVHDMLEGMFSQVH